MEYPRILTKAQKNLLSQKLVLYWIMPEDVIHDKWNIRIKAKTNSVYRIDLVSDYEM
jgi:hypothetical protein